MRDKILAALTDDLRNSYWQQFSDNPLAGHCYVASEALYHLEPGRYKPMQVVVPVSDGTVSHWYLQDRETGEVVDLTAAQFSGMVPYDKGRGRGFLTKQPSKRAQIVLARVSETSLLSLTS